MIEIIAAAAAVLGDQLFKNWIVKVFAGMPADHTRRIFPGLIHLTYVENRGASFGMLKGFGWLFLVIAAAFAALVIWALVTKRLKNPFSRWAAAAVMAGALGNAIDRIARGYVVDMFEVEFMNFAVFNIADIFITLGGIAFCAWLLWEEARKKKSGSSDEDTENKSE
ncbi:MAG: signal peptidase II [Oscillospiraceae bacterium]|nr:signal peptidase II [Oscillospiraceae bacterium]